jgi:gluconolactonase
VFAIDPGSGRTAFGGADRKTLFITESSSGQILMAKVPVAGGVLYSHQ